MVLVQIAAMKEGGRHTEEVCKAAVRAAADQLRDKQVEARGLASALESVQAEVR